ncbi:MAG TPA: outer membrane protein assembly factor BamE [Tepidisphaeraceae bacterium]|nr:outer membrane protein assembly factor BamE [Tepidisphaeraceae bacterium]
MRQALLRTDSSQPSSSRTVVPAGGMNRPSQSLSGSSNSFTADRVARLKEGMVESQVIDLLGPPDQQDNFGSLVTWHYFVDQEASSLGFVRDGDSVLTLKYWAIHKTYPDPSTSQRNAINDHVRHPSFTRDALARLARLPSVDLSVLTDQLGPYDYTDRERDRIRAFYVMDSVNVNMLVLGNEQGSATMHVLPDLSVIRRYAGE